MKTITHLAAAVACGLALTACGGGEDTCVITPSVISGSGTISPSVDITIKSGLFTVFVLTPGSGYTIASIGGTCGGTLDGNIYTTKAIITDCTVVASFSRGT